MYAAHHESIFLYTQKLLCGNGENFSKDYGLFTYTFSFSFPDKWKSQGFKSRDLGGNRPGQVTRSPNTSPKTSRESSQSFPLQYLAQNARTVFRYQSVDRRRVAELISRNVRNLTFREEKLDCFPSAH
jgi:hypothetical protein